MGRSQRPLLVAQPGLSPFRFDATNSRGALREAQSVRVLDQSHRLLSMKAGGVQPEARTAG